MQAITISEFTPRGMPIAPQLPETEQRSPVVHLPALRREWPELLKHAPTAEKLLFAAHIDTRLKITEPFVVKMERHDEMVTASIDEINEFGCGSNSSEALRDLGETLAELYFSLRDNADRLSADLRAVWLKLNEHIQPRQR
ncbi:MAG: hypothetical protein FJ280_28115 [Planctomycetes bacterium]|nr:hypothetical protein [Planctomycetota bacterium]